MKTFFTRIKDGLQKSRTALNENIARILPGNTPIDDETLEELEELLITSDIGFAIADDVIQKVKKKTKGKKDITVDETKSIIKDVLLSRFMTCSRELNLTEQPTIILMVGVNGSGKTTTIGKLANNFTNEGKKVLIAAGDTFRAAAIEQLEVWGNRAGVEIVRHQEGSDPSAVIFDAITAAKARNCDIVLADTAGRLHSKINLMEELKKIQRVIHKAQPGAPHETLLVLDGTVGQNAIQQAKHFNKVVNLTGIVITKLDGTARGGVIVKIEDDLKIPVKFIGTGETAEDLNSFHPEEFLNALL